MSKSMIVKILFYGFRASEKVILQCFLTEKSCGYNSSLRIETSIQDVDIAIVDIGYVEELEKNSPDEAERLRHAVHDIPLFLIFHKGTYPVADPRYGNQVKIILRPVNFKWIAQQICEIIMEKDKKTSASQQHHEPNILVVDDSPSLRADMRIKLSRYKVNVELAANAESAISKVSERSYSLVFMDVMMPGNMDGYDACKTIKSLHPELPVVMLTSKDSMFSKVRGKIARCDDYIAKPATAEIIEEVLAKHVFDGDVELETQPG